MLGAGEGWKDTQYQSLFSWVKGEKLKKKNAVLPSYTVGGNVSWYSHYGKQYGGSSEN